MRVQGYKVEGAWVKYGFDTTYTMGWDNCCAYVKRVYEFTKNPEVLISPIAGIESHQIEIKESDDIWNIPEAGYIVVRGSNQIYDGAPFQIRFFNQTSQVHLELPVAYLEALIKNDDSLLDEENKKHVFDKFMDSIEITGEVSLYKHCHMIDD